MLIDILDQEKKLVGLFIDFKRKQILKNKNLDYRIESFIDGICAKQTYNKISKGIIVKESQLYDELLAELGYEYLYDNNIKTTVRSKEQKLLAMLEKSDLSLFYKYLNAFIKKIAVLQNFALESVLYDCFTIIKKDQLSECDIDIILQMYSMLDDIAKEICGFFLLRYIYHYCADKYSFTKLKNLGILNLRMINNQWWILSLFIRWELYYSASIYCENLLQICISEKNKMMAFRIQISRLFIIMAIEPNSFESYVEEIETSYLIELNSNNYDMYQFMHIVGLYYYSKNSYDKAWKYFIESVKYEKSYFPEILYLNHIATIQGMILPIELTLQRENLHIEKEYQVIYRYFCMKHQNIGIQVLEDYLWDHCRWLVKETYPSWIMKDIIRAELAWIAQQTGNRKRLYRFNKLNEK